MYSFEKQDLNVFVIHKSYQQMGDKHHKRFGVGVTPLNQGTLNVYIQGQFKLKCAGFEQVLNAGQTSLEVALETYPAGQVFEEEVLSDTGIRFCIGCKQSGIWYRAKIDVTPENPVSGPGLVVVLSGEINGQGVGSCFVLNENEVGIGTGTVIRCWV